MVMEQVECFYSPLPPLSEGEAQSDAGAKPRKITISPVGQPLVVEGAEGKQAPAYKTKNPAKAGFLLWSITESNR